MTNIEAVVNKEVEKAPTYLYGLFDDNVFSQFVAFFYYMPTPPLDHRSLFTAFSN